MVGEGIYGVTLPARGYEDFSRLRYGKMGLFTLLFKGSR